VIKLRRTTWPPAVDQAVRSSGDAGVLAAVQLEDGRWVAGTRAALYLPDGDGLRRVGWETVDHAGWKADESVLEVWETAPLGTPMRHTRLAVDDLGRFGQLLRERVGASVLLQRHVPLQGRKGVRIVGRRNPADRDAPIEWSFVLDKGLNAEEPGLLERADAALNSLRSEFDV
jgi:hypothetical protein